MNPLIIDMMTACTMRVRTGASDGKFGQTNTYADGATFQAAIIKQTGQQPASYQATEAERPVLDEIYTVVVPTGTALHHHDVFRRESDGAVFRVTGDARDTEAPAMSTVQIAKTTAERWAEE